jgi:Fe-S cluster biogenesis protein NfuA
MGHGPHGNRKPETGLEGLRSWFGPSGSRRQAPGALPENRKPGRAARGTARSRQNRGMPELSDEERDQRSGALQELIELMRPAVQSDGGDLELVAFDVEAGTVEVQLQGACSSCAISSSTLQGGVERILKSRLEWVTDVTGGVDESADPFESAAMGQGGYVPKW